MPGGNGEHHLVPVERLERDPTMATGCADHPELELAPPNVFHHRVSVGNGQCNVNLRMETLEFPEHDGQHAAAGACGSADLEPALELAFGLLAELREQLLLEPEQPLCPAIETKARLGRLDPTARAVEEPLPDALLERPDLQAHGRLRHAELGGGLGEAPPLDHRTKGRELLRIHKNTL